MRLTLILLFVLWSGPLIAQTSIGLYLGYNGSNLAGDVPQKAQYQGKVGYLFGANVDFKLKDDVLLSLQPGFSEANTSVAYKDTTNLYRDSIALQFKRITLPIEINVVSNNKKWYFSSGLIVDYLVNSSTSSGDQNLELSHDLSPIDVSLSFGITYLIPIGQPFLFISGRYAQGLVNITNEPDERSLIPRVKSKGLQLRVGLQVPLKPS